MLTIRGTASSVRFDPKFLKTAVAVQVSGLAHSNIWECPPKNHENPPPSIKTISFGRGKTSSQKSWLLPLFFIYGQTHSLASFKRWHWDSHRSMLYRVV